jgi:hypothetical protein
VAPAVDSLLGDVVLACDLLLFDAAPHDAMASASATGAPMVSNLM